MKRQPPFTSLKTVYLVMQVSLLAVVLLMLDHWAPAPNGDWLVWPVAALPAAWLWSGLCITQRWHPAWELLGGVALPAGLVWAVLHWTLPGAPAPATAMPIIKPVMLVAALGIGWIQGWRLARARLTQARVNAGVHWVVGILLVLMLVPSLEGAGVRMAWGWFMVLAPACLASLWLARRVDGPPGGAMGRGLGAFFLALVLMALIGLGLWLLVSRELMALFAEPAGWALGWLAWLGGYAERAIVWLVRLWHHSSPKGELAFEPPTNLTPENTVLPPPGDGGPGLLSQVVLALVAVVGLAVVAFLAYWCLRRLLASMAQRPEDGPERLGLAELLRRAGAALLALAVGLLGQAAALLGALAPAFRRGRRGDGEAQYYRRLERWSRARGLGRRPHQTPLEHLGRLRARHPDLAPDMEMIVAAFLVRRYGPGGRLSGEEAGSLRQAWRRVAAGPRKKKGQAPGAA